MTPSTLTSHGAAGTVTGSRHVVRTDAATVLVDCGLFQGDRELRRRNWEPFPVPARDIDAVLLTHAHLDHSGYLPRLVREGFRGPIITSAATTDLCRVLLRDSAYIEEREADLANRFGHTRHRPAKPLYTQADSKAALSQFVSVPFGEAVSVTDDILATFHRAGHILGAASITVDLPDAKVVFSGDLGRSADALMPPPDALGEADHVVVESTYGDRVHPEVRVLDELEAVIRRVAGRGGTLIIPAFAVGRTQNLLVHLHALRLDGRIPQDLPIFLDSPMAVDASDIYEAHPDDHVLYAGACARAFGVARYVASSDESRFLDTSPFPKVIVSASGMLQGGRVMHHLKSYLGDANACVLFTGFQAPGTRGAALLGGAKSLNIHGQDFPVRAEIREIGALSAHADRVGLMRWLANFHTRPTVHVTHGTPEASRALAERIEAELGLAASVAEPGKAVSLARQNVCEECA